MKNDFGRNKMARSKLKASLWLALPLVVMLAALVLGNIKRAYSNQDWGLRDPQTEQYLNDLKYIVIDIEPFSDHDIYMSYAPPNQYEDYGYRVDNNVFSNLLYPDGRGVTVVWMQKLKDELLKK
jgi:hypothetical protein